MRLGERQPCKDSLLFVGLRPYSSLVLLEMPTANRSNLKDSMQLRLPRYLLPLLEATLTPSAART